MKLGAAARSRSSEISVSAENVACPDFRSQVRQRRRCWKEIYGSTVACGLLMLARRICDPLKRFVLMEADEPVFQNTRPLVTLSV